MTATADMMIDQAAALQPVRSVDGGRMMMRLGMRLIGAALVLAALGVWFAPGATWESDVLLFKLVLSVCGGLAGLGLLQASGKPEQPQIEIDTIRRELRLMRPGLIGRRAVLRRCRFDDLGKVEKKGAHLRLWDECNALLAEVTLSDHKMMRSLVAGLRDAGKLD